MIPWFQAFLAQSGIIQRLSIFEFADEVNLNAQAFDIINKFLLFLFVEILGFHMFILEASDRVIKR